MKKDLKKNSVKLFLPWTFLNLYLPIPITDSDFPYLQNRLSAETAISAPIPIRIGYRFVHWQQLRLGL